jgi:hypothetical protein
LPALPSGFPVFPGLPPVVTTDKKNGSKPQPN